MLVENSQKDSKNFSSLQELVTIILDLLLICVDSSQAAAKYIKYLVCVSFTNPAIVLMYLLFSMNGPAGPATRSFW